MLTLIVPGLFWSKFPHMLLDLKLRYFNKMVLQNTLRSDESAILKSIHVREIVCGLLVSLSVGEAMIDR